MYGFPVVTNDYNFLHDFAYHTNALIRVTDVDEESCDHFMLCYPDYVSMQKAMDALENILCVR